MAQLHTMCTFKSTNGVPQNSRPVYAHDMDDEIDRALQWAKAKGWNQKEFAGAIGATSADITNWKKRGLPSDRRASVARALGRTVDELIYGRVSSSNNQQTNATGSVGPSGSNNVRPIEPRARVPQISWVQAGSLSEVQDFFQPGEADQWEDVFHTTPSGHAFALVVEGESMISPYPQDKSFPPGTILIVDPDRQALAGDFVIAKDVATQQATFKKLAHDGGRWFLKPLNPSFPTIEIDDPSLRIIGKVIEYRFGGKL